MAVACAGHLPFKIGGATSDPMCALHKLRWGSDPLFFAVPRDDAPEEAPASPEPAEEAPAVEEEAPAAEEDSPEAAEAKAALAARLAELEKEIETAVEAEDYERADELNTAADGLRAELDAL